jgi:hypothetical protein
MATTHDNYPTNFAQFQTKLDPRLKRFGAETRHDVIWGDKVQASESLRQRMHLLD